MASPISIILGCEWADRIVVLNAIAFVVIIRI